jgi:hypothetical protein
VDSSLSTRKGRDTVPARTFETDGRNDLDGFRRVGVRASAKTFLGYEIAVEVTDVRDAVRCAGGWLCDRVRAGWNVTVTVPDGADVRPLTILGVATRAAGDDLPEPADASEMPAAMALAADGLAQDERLLRDVLKTLDRGTVEVTIWGERLPSAMTDRVESVRYRLSAAARAFKAQALVAAGEPAQSVDAEELFHSSALWYPPDGSDMSPVS